jgi:site-specific DNA-adenine methylase
VPEITKQQDSDEGDIFYVHENPPYHGLLRFSNYNANAHSLSTEKLNGIVENV